MTHAEHAESVMSDFSGKTFSDPDEAHMWLEARILKALCAVREEERERACAAVDSVKVIDVYPDLFKEADVSPELLESAEAMLNWAFKRPFKDAIRTPKEER